MFFMSLIFQPAVATAKGKIMLNLPTQHKLGILQGLVVEQPVQLCPLCRGVAVLVLHGDAVNGKGSATLEPGFHPVGVHVVVAGKQVVHREPPCSSQLLLLRWKVPACPFADS